MEKPIVKEFKSNDRVILNYNGKKYKGIVTVVNVDYFRTSKLCSKFLPDDCDAPVDYYYYPNDELELEK